MVCPAVALRVRFIIGHFLGHRFQIKDNIGLDFADFSDTDIDMLSSTGILAVNGNQVFPFFKQFAFSPYRALCIYTDRLAPVSAISC